MLASYESVALGGLGIPSFGTGDPLAVYNFFQGAYRWPQGLLQGYVVTYNPTTHTASVHMAGMQSIWTCFFADEMLSYSFGFSETHPPKEGERVLVSPIEVSEQAGVIVGRIPYMLSFAKPKGDLYDDPDKYNRRAYTQDDEQKRTWDPRLPCYMAPLIDQNNDSTHIATHFRPTDVIPGEFAHLNQHNCGIKGGLFSATLLGGGASLRLSALTNAARLSCESYIRHSLHGSTHEFHNGRYLSSERNYALYQEERLGGSTPQETVWTKDAEAPLKGEDQTMQPRMKDLTGFFGHLSSRFCFRPDPDCESPRVQGAEEIRECGVSRETIDPSGQYRLSAAGMIAIERTGRIPVPVRNCYPTDEGHDISSDPERLQPFKHNKDPGYRQLELFDRQAYDLKNQYARVDGLGFENPDYDVPQEEDLKPLEDKYDEKFFGNETVKLKEFDKRKAGMYIGEDGSIIIRDAWGSEIVMLGGNVTIACAGNVMMLPGKTQLTIAGDDIVQKAQNSIDIHASAHDIRLSAARNMEIVGGGDGKQYPGGVIIESRGNGGAWDGTGDKGENSAVSGITLKAASHVTLDAGRMNLRSKSDTRIISGDEDLNGNISMVAKNIRSIAKTTVIAGAPKEEDPASDKVRSRVRDMLSDTDAGEFGVGFDEEKLAAVTISQKSVMTVAESIGLFADHSLAATKGSKFPVPMMWADIESNIAEIVRPNIAGAMSDLSDEEGASAGFDRKSLEKMVFCFRTSEQCGTTSGWGLDGQGSFKMYEPAWAQAMKAYETLKGRVEAKPYEEKAEWDNGRPWPGEAAEDDAKYAKIKGDFPVNMTKEGLNVRRDKVKDESVTVEVSLAEGYLVRK